MNQPIEFVMWNPEQNREFSVTTTLEAVILNPSGFRMDQVGLLLLNKERKARGLTEYRFNSLTGTYDEDKRD